MPWSRYDDALPLNKKVAQLRARGEIGIAAMGLHVLANCWSRHEGTKGHIPHHMPEHLAGRCGIKLARLLAEVTMFDRADEDDEEAGWWVHDFDDYSGPDDTGESAAERKLRVSAARAAAGKQGGKATAKRKQSSGIATSKPKANGWQNPSPVPDPVPEKNSSPHLLLTPLLARVGQKLEDDQNETA